MVFPYNGIIALKNQGLSNLGAFQKLLWLFFKEIQSHSGIDLFGTVFTIQFLCLCLKFSSFQLLSCVRLFATPWIAAHQASLSITNSRSSLKLGTNERVTRTYILSVLLFACVFYVTHSVIIILLVRSNRSALKANRKETCHIYFLPDFCKASSSFQY